MNCHSSRLGGGGLLAKRTGEKYEAILDAAEQVFAEYGYHRAQVARIAREAKVADGTVYLYFENKEDVLISLFKERMRRFSAAVAAELAGIPPGEEQLAKIVEFHFHWLGQHRQRAVVTQIELRQSEPAVRRGISEAMQDYFRIIENAVEDGKRAGRIDPALDTKVARKVIFGAMDEVVTSWVLSHREYPLESLAPAVFAILKGGIYRG